MKIQSNKLPEEILPSPTSTSNTPSSPRHGSPLSVICYPKIPSSGWNDPRLSRMSRPCCAISSPCGDPVCAVGSFVSPHLSATDSTPPLKHTRPSWPPYQNPILTMAPSSTVLSSRCSRWVRCTLPLRRQPADPGFSRFRHRQTTPE
jgi:hypothetical protein